LRNLWHRASIHDTPIATMATPFPTNFPPDSMVLQYRVNPTGPLHLPARCTICRQRLEESDLVAESYCGHSIHISYAPNHFGRTGHDTERKHCPSAGACLFNLLPPPVSLRVVDVQHPDPPVTCSVCDPTSTDEQYGQSCEMRCDGQHKFHIECIQQYWRTFKTQRLLQTDDLWKWKNMPCPMCSM
jgi:hypothetical protein